MWDGRCGILDLRKENRKSAALAGGTFNLDSSPMGLGYGAGDAEPETDATTVDEIIS